MVELGRRRCERITLPPLCLVRGHLRCAILGGGVPLRPRSARYSASPGIRRRCAVSPGEDLARRVAVSPVARPDPCSRDSAVPRWHTGPGFRRGLVVPARRPRFSAQTRKRRASPNRWLARLRAPSHHQHRTNQGGDANSPRQPVSRWPTTGAQRTLWIAVGSCGPGTVCWCPPHSVVVADQHDWTWRMMCHVVADGATEVSAQPVLP